MRIFNVTKIGVLLLCILLVIPMITGCANEQAETESESNQQDLLVQVEKKWDAVITNDGSLVTKVKITSYIPQPPTIELQPSQSKLCDDVEQINMIIDLFSNKEVEFQNLPTDQEGFDVHVSSQYGKETCAIEFFDSQDQKIMRIAINEDNVAEIYEPYWYEGSEVWYSSCVVRFSEPIFGLLKQLFENIA